MKPNNEAVLREALTEIKFCCAVPARQAMRAIAERALAATATVAKDGGEVRCPTNIEHDRDGKSERCLLCNTSWPEGAESACDKARQQLSKAPKPEASAEQPISDDERVAAWFAANDKYIVKADFDAWLEQAYRDGLKEGRLGEVECRSGGDLDALIQEYGNTPVMGVPRTRRVVMQEIYRLAGEIFGRPAPDPSTAVILFVLDLEEDDGYQFLHLWNEGEFDLCRKLFPEAPPACYIGADQFYKEPQ